jgi:hypothetical protein
MKRPPERCLWALDARARNRWIRKAGDELDGHFLPVAPSKVRCKRSDILICSPCEKRHATKKKARGR